MNCIAYRDGYKYQLAHEYSVATALSAPFDVVTEYIQFDTAGNLTIAQGYAWDGPSGPTIDTLNSMRASLIHDALYQLMRGGLLNPDYYRVQADKLFYHYCVEDGMSILRADVWYEALRIGAGPAADPKNDKPIIYAPEGCEEST